MPKNLSNFGPDTKRITDQLDEFTVLVTEAYNLIINQQREIERLLNWLCLNEVEGNKRTNLELRDWASKALGTNKEAP